MCRRAKINTEQIPHQAAKWLSLPVIATARQTVWNSRHFCDRLAVHFFDRDDFMGFQAGPF